jgi:hypothetical protein
MRNRGAPLNHTSAIFLDECLCQGSAESSSHLRIRFFYELLDPSVVAYDAALERHTLEATGLALFDLHAQVGLPARPAKAMSTSGQSQKRWAREFLEATPASSRAGLERARILVETQPRSPTHSRGIFGVLLQHYASIPSEAGKQHARCLARDAHHFHELLNLHAHNSTDTLLIENFPRST